jgi:nitrate reductase assembly molybdenum cofactor insertion protein NarJ
VSEEKDQSFIILKHMIESLENSLEKRLSSFQTGFDHMYKRIENIGGHKDRVEAVVKDNEHMKKLLSKHQDSITKLEYAQKQRDSTKTTLINPAIITFATILISAIVGGIIGYKGTTINLDNGTYHEHVNRNES